MPQATEPIIRIARIEEILDLRWRLLRAGLPRETARFEGDDEAATQHFAACVNGEVIGCATFLQRPFEQQPAFQLRGMAVREDFQRRGAGRRLLEFAERTVRDFDPAALMWCNARVPAAAFYQGMGWRIVGEEFEISTAGPHVKMMKSFAAIVR